MEPARELEAPMAALNERLLAVYLAELKSDSWRVRRKAARGLARLGKVAMPAIPMLRQMVRWDGDRRVREAALRAVEQVAEAEA